MERKINPCKSRSGKWKRQRKLQGIILSDSHLTRRPRNPTKNVCINKTVITATHSSAGMEQIVPEFLYRDMANDVHLEVDDSIAHASQVDTQEHLTENTRPVADTGTADVSDDTLQNDDFAPVFVGPNQEPEQSITPGFSVEAGIQSNVDTSFVSADCEVIVSSNETLAGTLLGFISRHRISNIGASELLSIFRPADPTEIASLPNSVTSLEEQIFTKAPEFMIVWICKGLNCGKKLCVCTSTVNPQKQETSCCGITYTTNDSHALYLQPRSLLKRILPRIWPARSVGRMCQYMIQRFAELGLDPISDVSITANVDGLPASKSSNCSLWPILAYIDDCPPRLTQENILLLGLWVGHGVPATKPNMNLFLEPFVKIMESLLTDGVVWNPDSTTTRTTKVCISKVLCDSMGRPAVQNLQQLNGTFGCGYCFHRQTRHYFNHSELAELRTNAAHRKFCLEWDFGIADIERTRGITGRSTLLKIPYLDIINDLPPCFMHSLYLGVVRTITTMLISEPTCSGRIGKENLQALTDTLLLIRPPHRVSRTPRSLLDQVHWKAHEWGMWFMYYSPVLLYYFLDRQYWLHWIQLVYGCSILLSPCCDLDAGIQEDRLHSAKECLEKFSLDVSRLYGDKACRYNVHLLRHLTDLARIWGGNVLHQTMAPFESFNSKIQGFLNNSQYMGYQVGRRYWRHIHCTIPEKPNCNSLKHLWLKRDYTLPEGVLIPNSNDISVYYARIRTPSRRNFYSTSYTFGNLRDSSWMIMKDKRICEVQVYVKTTNATWAIVRVYTTSRFGTLSHIMKITGSSGYECVHWKELHDTVVRIDCKEDRYAAVFLNDVEHIRE